VIRRGLIVFYNCFDSSVLAEWAKRIGLETLSRSKRALIASFLRSREENLQLTQNDNKKQGVRAAAATATTTTTTPVAAVRDRPIIPSSPQVMSPGELTPEKQSPVAEAAAAAANVRTSRVQAPTYGKRPATPAQAGKKPATPMPVPVGSPHLNAVATPLKPATSVQSPVQVKRPATRAQSSTHGGKRVSPVQSPQYGKKRSIFTAILTESDKNPAPRKRARRQ
jgi:hypothetical protein